MLRSTLLAAFILAVTATGASGADQSSGCGPGWYVFKDTSFVSSALRLTTNGVLFPTVTFGMTSGTSNCAQHKLVENDPESLKFATLAYHDLVIQMAQGRGEHLAAFAHTLGCPWQVQDRFNALLQRAYPEILPADNVAPEEMLGRVVEQLRAEPVLATNCNVGVG